MYRSATSDLHTADGPEITGAGGRDVTVKQRAGPLPQELTALTQMFADAEVNVGPKTTLTDNPVLLPTIVTPAGTVHRYEVAPATAATEYVAEVLHKLFPGPLILLG